MKKFIKALEDNGGMKRIVDSAITKERLSGTSITEEGLNLLLDFEMAFNNESEDIFLQEARKLAVKKVFEYVQKQVEEKKSKTDKMDDASVDKKEDIDEKIEDMIMECMSKALDSVLADVLKHAFDSCK